MLLPQGVIVTVEYADRKVSQGISRTSAYIEGASRMAWPIIASTVTTLMVFLPLLVWPGIVGSFMKYLPITVMCVLSASLFMALIFIPVLGGKIGKEITDSEPEQDIATVLGAVVGASIGSEIAANKREGIELLIETDSGSFVSIIQEIGAYSFFNGQKVRIIRRNGKSRVIPSE